LYLKEREGEALEWINLPVGMEKYRVAVMDIVIS
jgi:hypothetical protein